MARIALKHDQSSAILAKQLLFNHSALTFNTHDKSAVKMMAIVVGLFLATEFIYAVILYYYFFTKLRVTMSDIKYRAYFMEHACVRDFHTSCMVKYPEIERVSAVNE